MTDDELTDFYRLLYAWEDARDDYLGRETELLDDATVMKKKIAAVKAKSNLVEFVNGLKGKGNTAQ